MTPLGLKNTAKRLIVLPAAQARRGASDSISGKLTSTPPAPRRKERRETRTFSRAS